MLSSSRLIILPMTGLCRSVPSKLIRTDKNSLCCLIRSLATTNGRDVFVSTEYAMAKNFGLSCYQQISDPAIACLNKRTCQFQTDDDNNNGRNNDGKNMWFGVAGISGFSLGFLGFFEKKEPLSPEDELLLKIKRGILAIQEGEPQKAERHLGDAWKMSEELEREDVKTQIMDIQANLALQKGELDRALRLFQLVTQRMVYHQGVALNDNTVVEISIKLAQIFAMQGKMEESLSGFQFCVDTQREKIKQGIIDEDTLMLGAWSLQSLAQAYMTKATEGDTIDKVAISKAAEFANEAHGYVAQAVGPDSQQAIAISSDLASILALQGNVDGALKQLEECEKLAAEKYQYLQAAIRVNTGSLYLQKGDYSEAQRICKEARMMASSFKDLESVMRADECIAKSSEMRTEKYPNEKVKTPNS